MGAVDRFLADPVDFMTNNVVSTPEGGSVNQSGGKKFFTLERLSGTAASVDRPLATIPTWMARPASGGGGEGIMEIYWCPYQDDTIQSTVVGNEANVMFTAPMNGLWRREPVERRLAVCRAHQYEVAEQCLEQAGQHSAGEQVGRHDHQPAHVHGR